MQDDREKQMIELLENVIEKSFKQHEEREQQQANKQINLISKRLIDKHETGPAHMFINDLISKEARRQERRERLEGNFIFYILIAATGAIGTAIWTTFFKK